MNTLIVLAILATPVVLAEEDGKKIRLDAPKDWKGETITLPV